MNTVKHPGWSLQKLEMVGTFLKGKGILKEELSETGLPAVRYGEIYTTHNFKIKAFHSFISHSIARESERIFRNDILFAGSGETVDEIGKAVAYTSNAEAYAGGDIVILRVDPKVADAEFLGYALNSSPANKQKRMFGQGHSVVHIYPSDLAELRVLLPPLPEQKKIARILSTWDRAIEKTEQLIAEKQQLKKGLMQQLLTGKVRFKEFNTRWRKMRIEELATIIRGSSPRPKGDLRYYGGLVPRLMVEDVTRDGKYVTPEVDFLTEEGAKLSRPCKAGTLTIVCSGDVGTPSFLAVDACIHDGFLAAIDIVQDLDVHYLYYQLLRLKNKLERGATHGGVFTNLTTQILKNFEISVSTVEEQRRIAFLLSMIDDELKDRKFQLGKFRKQKQGLMHKLLTGQIQTNHISYEEG